jgi:maltose alpha-D-glucosyltransferase/alpha-amylase
MGRVLTERGFTGIAPMLGEVIRHGGTGETSALAIAQGFVENQGDGSAWTHEMLTRVIDEQSVAPRDRDPFEPYQAFARVLGRRTGEMHAKLAQPSDDPAFAPEEADEEAIHRWFGDARQQVETAFGAIERCSDRYAELAGRLSSGREDILRRLGKLFEGNEGTLRTRIHGDFHLGQVLVSGSDVIIIDFEGEPVKSLSERRAKLSPLRDVAGMIRSFDYAAGIVEREEQFASSGQAHTRARSLLSTFRETATSAFLAGYAEGRGQPLSKGEERLITAFAIEKAAYEIVYEAANRPDWIGIPLRGLATLSEHAIPVRDVEYA